MRRDMKRKLVDTYRVRSREKNADVKRDRRDSRRLASRLTDDNELEDDVPTGRTSGMRMKGYDRKQFGENLTPLYRFLWSCRGKHWDKVYSEISEHCDKDSAVGRHIYEHLWFAVAKDVLMVDGKPHTFSAWRDGLYPVTSNGDPGGYENLYIHPKTGVLLEAPRAKKSNPKVDDSVRQLSNLRFAIQVADVWYLVELGLQEYRKKTKIVDDVEKTVDVPVYEDCVYPEAVFDKLPREAKRRLQERREMYRPQGAGRPAAFRTKKAVLYVKVAKTMSKKEKKTYLL